MRKILLVLAVACLASSCVFGVAVPCRRGYGYGYGAGVQVSHVHGYGCGHVFVNGAWVVVR